MFVDFESGAPRSGPWLEALSGAWRVGWPLVASLLTWKRGRDDRSGAPDLQSDALDAAGASLWAWDPGTRRLSWRSLPPLPGDPSDGLDESSPESLLSLVHSSDRVRVRQEIERADGRFEIEFRLEREDRTVRIRGAVHRGEQGSLSGYVLPVEEVLEEPDAAALVRQSQLLDQVHDAVISTDLEGKIETWNAAAERIYGYSLDQVAGKHIGMLYFADQEAYFEQQMTAAVLASGAHEFVGRFRHRSGAQLYADVRLAVLRDADGSPVGIVSCSHDVTRRREEEQASQLQARVLDSMDEGVCLTNGSGVVLYTNPACDRMYGTGRHSLYRRELRRLFAGDEEEVERRWGDVVEELSRTGSWEGELENVRADQQRFTSFAKVSQLMLADEPHWIWVQQDVTQRKRDLAALAERERRFRSMADSTPMIVWLLDADRACTYTNAAWHGMTGALPEESLGDGWLRSIHADDRNEFEAEFDRAFGSSEAFETETRFTNGVGDIRWVVCRGAPRLDGDGAFAGYVVSALDVTERKLAEEERRRVLRAAQRTVKLESLGVMAGGIAHDFNNLLVSILGYAELALSEMPPDSKGRDAVAALEASARQAGELTGQILSFTGRRRVETLPLDLNEAVGDTVKLIETSLRRKTRFSVELDAEPAPVIEGDGGQIRQVILNLALNAADAIKGDEGLVTLRTGRTYFPRERLDGANAGEALDAGVYAYVEVEDNGRGLSEETLGRIFDPFFTTKSTGRGLGLASALGVARAHRGAIEVDSEEGRGSVFRAVFPALHGVRAASSEALEPQLGSETVLLIDDDTSVLDSTRRTLERYGYRVFAAENGEQGVRRLAEQPEEFDVVLLDVVMNGLSARETLARLRGIRPDLPVLMWSGYNEEEISDSYHGRPISGFIQKPCGQAELTGRIRRALAKPHARSAAGV